MQYIYPPAGTSLAEIPDLAGAYAYPDLGGDAAWVRANMVTSIDGAAQGPNGRSATVSSPPDRTVLSLLRELADVVLVGAGTVRAERYGPAREGTPIAVVSRSLDLDPSRRLFTDAASRTIVLTVEASPPDRRAALAAVADVTVVGDTSIDVHVAIRALVERGLSRVLCEGGPHLLARVIEADRLDELCYTITPKIVGGHSARLVETPLPLASHWALAHVIEDTGTLLTRWVKPPRP